MLKLKQYCKKCLERGKWILPILASSCIAYICSLLFISLINYAYPSELGEKEIVEPMSKDWFINAFFDHHNIIDSSIEIDENREDDIVIINIDQLKSNPRDLAEILKKIGELNPRCMALDIFMPQDNDSVDYNLTNVIDSLNLHNNIVIASWYNDATNLVEQSYFNNNGKIKSGIINKSNLLELSNNYKGYTTFSAQIAKSLNYDCELEKQYVINFRLKRLNIHDISSTEEVDELKVQDPNIDKKILIIGSTHPINDNKDLPFVLDYINQAPGCCVLAYELSSLMNLKSEDKYKTPFCELSSICNMLFCIIALSLYLLLLKIPSQFKEINTCIFCKFKFSRKVSKWSNRILNMPKTRSFFILKNVFRIFIKVLALIAAEILVIRFSFYWTEVSMSIPNIFLFAVSLLFVDEIYKKINNTISSYD